MSTTSPNESSLSCRLINASGPLADEIIKRLSQQDILHTTEAKATNYIIWFNPNEASALHDIESYIRVSQEVLSKILVVYTLDVVGDDEKQNAIQRDILLEYVTKQGIDIRFVCVRGEWESQLDSSSKSILQQIAVELKRGKLIYVDESNIYPFDLSIAAEKIFRFWFDRGHRGKTALVHGEKIAYSNLVNQLISHHSQLKNSMYQLKWQEKISPENAETILIQSNYEQYRAYLETLIPTTQIPAPIASTPLSPKPPTPARSTPPIPRFQAVVVEEGPVAPVVPSTPPRQIQPPPSIASHPSPRGRGATPFILLGIGIILIAALFPYGLATIRLWQAGQTTAETPAASIHALQASLDQSSSTLTTIGDITQGIQPFNWLESRLSSQITQSRITLLKAEAGQLLAQGIKRSITTTDGSPYDSFQQAKHVLDNIYLLQSTKENASLTDRQWVNQARQMIDMFPQLIPSNKKITVMILLQNNLELRPSGGFIGAVALLTFDHGKLLTYDTRDIYDLDSNLKGVVTPPPEIRTYLGETSWYFRDANWSPNSVESANMANWFLEKEWGSKADIVIGINLNTLKQILSASSPITLPDGQMVSSENLLATAFNHQDVPTAKPDSGKQEFMSLFLKPLIDQITTSPSSQTVNIASALGLGLETGELTIYAVDPSVQALLADNGWSGNPVQVTCAINLREPCSKDLIYVNEANVGINKANFYLSRKINHNITLTDQVAQHTHHITYTNASPNEAWPAGVYKNFTRIVLPASATQIAISFDGKTLTNSDYTITSVQNAVAVSLFMEIKPQATGQLILSYQIPLDQNYQSYAFSIQKQTGISVDPLSLTIVPPVNKALRSTTPTLDANNTFSGSFDRNLTFSLGQ